MKRYVLAAVLLGLTTNFAVAMAAKPTGKSLTIEPSPNPVVFGRSVTFSGRLTGPKHAGKTVQLQADDFPFGSYKTVATATTGSNGAWTAKDKPPVNTRYRAKQGGTTSAWVLELVRIRVSLRVSDRTPAAGQRVRFSGRACPQHDGALVRIQRLSKTKKWRTVRRTRLKDLPGSTCSRYRRTFRVFHDGTYRTFVVTPDLNHASGRSRRKHIDVH